MTEFWGTEVKPGKTVSCGAGNDSVIRISQVALGETKQRKEDVVLYVNVVDSLFVIGTLRAKSHPHMMCDLRFDKEFELSHSSKTASVFFCGYRSFKSDSAEDEDKGKSNGYDPAKHGGKKDEYKDDDFPSSDDMETFEDDSVSSTENLIIPHFIEDIPEDVPSTDEDESSEHEGTSKKIGKRAAEICMEPASVKKNVAAPTGQKSGGKTDQSRRSSKKASKNSKLKDKLGKSTSGNVCELCSRPFVSDIALQAHRNVKHPGNFFSV